MWHPWESEWVHRERVPAPGLLVKWVPGGRYLTSFPSLWGPSGCRSRRRKEWKKTWDESLRCFQRYPHLITLSLRLGRITEKYSEGFYHFPKCKGLQKDFIFLAKVSETCRDGVPSVVWINQTLRSSQNWS